MGIKEKINKTILDKNIKKPQNMGNLVEILSMEDPSSTTNESLEQFPSQKEDPQKIEKSFCRRCEKKTEGDKFCSECGTRRIQS
jgi:hypothetical protein